MEQSFCQDIYQMLCKKHPNQLIYAIGDHHFYHNNILFYTRKNFQTLEEMHSHMITSHNKVVKKDDIVLFLGDFSFKNSAISSLLNELNGHKYLILGNHDSKDLMKHYYRFGFEDVFLTPVRLHDVYVSHEPLMKDQRSDLQFQMICDEFKQCTKGVNYHGHVHDTDDFHSDRYRNMTCEALNYIPVKIGKTEKLSMVDQHNLLLEPNSLDQILNQLKSDYHMDPHFILSDYMYCLFLQTCMPYQSEFFINGSFGLWKKYRFLSKFSDLDISFFYQPNMSKRQNIRLFKEKIDSIYHKLNEMDGVHLQFIKRYPSLRILESNYTTKHPYYIKTFLDANVLFLDCYQKSDFIQLKQKSILEYMVEKHHLASLNAYQLPSFESLFLIPEGDIANLVLQLLFGKLPIQKQKSALKKLQYVYIQNFKNHHMVGFQDILHVSF